MRGLPCLEIDFSFVYKRSEKDHLTKSLVLTHIQKWVRSQKFSYNCAIFKITIKSNKIFHQLPIIGRRRMWDLECLLLQTYNYVASIQSHRRGERLIDTDYHDAVKNFRNCTPHAEQKFFCTFAGHGYLPFLPRKQHPLILDIRIIANKKKTVWIATIIGGVLRQSSHYSNLNDGIKHQTPVWGEIGLCNSSLKIFLNLDYLLAADLVGIYLAVSFYHCVLLL